MPMPEMATRVKVYWVLDSRAVMVRCSGRSEATISMGEDGEPTAG